MAFGAAAVPILKNVGGAVSQFPIAHGGFCDIDHEGDAGSQNADDSRGDPSLAGVEGRPKSRSDALGAGPNGA